MAAMDIDGGDASKALFAQVQFYVLLTDEIGFDEAEAVSKSVVCERSPYLPSDSLQSDWKNMALIGLHETPPETKFLSKKSLISSRRPLTSQNIKQPVMLSSLW